MGTASTGVDGQDLFHVAVCHIASVVLCQPGDGLGMHCAQPENQVEPENAYAAAELGRVYFEQGYYDHAGACYTMAKEIGAGNDYIEDMADFYLRAIEEVQK